MEEYRQYNRNPQNGGDLRRILAARKHVPVNTIIILVNLVVFLAVEATGYQKIPDICWPGEQRGRGIFIRSRNITDW